MLAKDFSVTGDEVVELGENGDPDIIWAEDQNVVFVVRIQDRMHQAVGMWFYGIIHGVRLEREG
jgi:hypothetical protein